MPNRETSTYVFKQLSGVSRFVIHNEDMLLCDVKYYSARSVTKCPIKSLKFPGRCEWRIRGEAFLWLTMDTVGILLFLSFFSWTASFLNIFLWVQAIGWSLFAFLSIIPLGRIVISDELGNDVLYIPLGLRRRRVKPFIAKLETTHNALKAPEQNIAANSKRL